MLKYILLIAAISGVAFTSMTCHTPTGPPNSSDTTSHAWTFTITMLGGASGSALYDVAIVNDTLAYAAGAVYLNDSTGQVDPNAYNLAIWDRGTWELSRLQFYTFQGQQYTGSYPTHAVWGFNPSDILVASDNSQITNWDGKSQSGVTWLPVSIDKVWAANTTNIYTGGDLGQIGFFNGNTWQKLESGTSLYFQDIYGSGGTILAVASYPGESPDKDIMQISGTTVTQLSTNGIQWPLTSVWFVPGHYYVVGQGIYEKTSLSQTVWQQDSVDTVDFFSCIRGNAWNDFFVAGSNGQLLHFNGKSWQSYQNLLGLQSGGISRIAVNGNLMIGVGYLGSKAVAFVGRRG